MARKFYIEDNVSIPAIMFENSQPSGYTEITDSDTLKKLYAKKYKERITDGADYYNDFRTSLYLDILNGNVTTTEAFDLEKHLEPVAHNLLTGNWMTAQNENTNLALSGIYDQTMKDDIQAYIDQYVTDNY